MRVEKLPKSALGRVHLVIAMECGFEELKGYKRCKLKLNAIAGRRVWAVGEGGKKLLNFPFTK